MTIEGIEGVGKTTQLARLSKILSERGIAYIVTREPGGTPLAEEIRELVLGSRGEAIARYGGIIAHVCRTRSASSAFDRTEFGGRPVGAVRSIHGCHLRVSGSGTRPRRRRRSAAWSCWCRERRRPDLTLLLDVPVAIGLQRARRRNEGTGIERSDEDRFELQRAEFFERVRAAYLARAAAEPRRIAVIDAGRSADAVTEQIISVLRARTWIS